MVESRALLKLRTPKRVPRVRIPPSPPRSICLGKTSIAWLDSLRGITHRCITNPVKFTHIQGRYYHVRPGSARPVSRARSGERATLGPFFCVRPVAARPLRSPTVVQSHSFRIFRPILFADILRARGVVRDDTLGCDGCRVQVPGGAGRPLRASAPNWRQI